MVRIPGTERRRWYGQKWFSEALGSIPPIVLTSVTAWGLYGDSTKPRGLFWAAVVAILWIATASLVKVRIAHTEDKERQQQHSPEGLAGCLHVLYRYLQAASGFTESEREKLRMTIHRVVEAEKEAAEPEWLEQVVPYVGGPGGKPGRRFRIASGIIGLAVRDKQPVEASRESDDYAAFLRELIQKWGYTRAEAQGIQEDRQSWMAVPIFDKNQEVLGTVFLDSNQRNFFAGEEKQMLIIRACSGVANYIEERYR
jgi:hypothetical protein